ncbi:MAG: amidase [Pseudomonadota bacterium]|nr:amidase [Pseudomonadota bacterium]
MTDLHRMSAREVATAIRARRVGALEALEHFIGRIERLDTRVNAVVVRDFDHAREAARAADAALARGEAPGPLHGVPMTVKESFNLAGLPTTWGSPAWSNNIAAADAIVPERLKQAGAVIMGKTNVPLMLADFQSYNAVYGTTHNPWAHGHTPGGSSGGGAAALAAGMTALEYGSDIGGSIRNPAHYSGVCGHKPTWGIVPIGGHALVPDAAPPDISVVGPLARSVDDLELALDLTAGADPVLAGGWRLELPRPEFRTVRDLRVALWLDEPFAEVDASVKAVLTKVAEQLSDAGADIDPEARPDFDPWESMLCYLRLLHSALAARQPDDAYAAILAKVAKLDPADDGPTAFTLRAQTMRHRDWLAANNQRTRLRKAWHRFFQSYDVLLCPVASVPAFPHDESPAMGARTLQVNGRPVRYFDQLFWAGFTGVAYLPGTVVPGGLTPQGLPVGVQVVGPEFGDRRTLAVARMIEALRGPMPVPEGFA